MEDLIEGVSKEIGPKWTLLFKELGLESRVRFDIVAKFDKQPDHLKSIYASQEALKLWLNQTSIKGLDEEEKVKRLLSIVHDIKPLQHIATQIGYKRYIGLQPSPPKQHLPVEDFEGGETETASCSYSHLPPREPHPPIVSSHPTPSAFGLDVHTASDQSRNSSGLFTLEPTQSFNVSGSEHLQAIPTTCREADVYLTGIPISFGDHGSYQTHFKTDRGEGMGIGSLEVPGSYSAGSVLPFGGGSTLSPICQSYGSTSMEEVTTLTTVPESITPLVDIETDPCDAVIIIQDRYHKYALLDISQRMLRRNWKQFGHKLKLRDDFLTKLEKSEKNLHERYYKLLVGYVEEYQENATFKIIRKVLRECNENLAAAILEERLRTRTELVISAIEYDFLTDKTL